MTKSKTPVMPGRPCQLPGAGGEVQSGRGARGHGPRHRGRAGRGWATGHIGHTSSLDARCFLSSFLSLSPSVSHGQLEEAHWSFRHRWIRGLTDCDGNCHHCMMTSCGRSHGTGLCPALVCGHEPVNGRQSAHRCLPSFPKVPAVPVVPAVSADCSTCTCVLPSSSMFLSYSIYIICNT